MELAVQRRDSFRGSLNESAAISGWSNKVASAGATGRRGIALARARESAPGDWGPGEFTPSSLSSIFRYRTQMMKIGGFDCVALAIIGLAVLPETSLAGAVTVDKPAVKCIAARNKQFAKVDGRIDSQVGHCLKAHSMGKPFDSGEGVSTVEDCVDADRKGKIEKAANKARAVDQKLCSEAFPGFAASDVETVLGAADLRGRDLASDVFGVDLESLVLRTTDKAASKCQLKTWKALAKCNKRRIGSFVKCKKKGLLRGEIASSAELESACLMQDSDPQTGQADPKGKIAKSCSDPEKGIGKPLLKNCSDLALDSLFPGCADAQATSACLDGLVACRVCRALNVADELSRNCDAFDNTLDDGSCGCGDGILTAAEECDDGNTADGDGCSSECALPAPTSSCLTILNDDPEATDGQYEINLPSGPANVYCDMTSAGGGWTRVGVLDGATTYCTNDSFTDLRSSPDATAGKIPDVDVRALMADVQASPVEVMFYVPADGRYIWRDLFSVDDFDTSSRHISSAHYCSNWQCDTGGSDFTLCSSEGSGCPVTGHGGAGNLFRKIYIDFDADGLRGGLHTNAGLCGLPNYNGAPIWVYVR